VGARPSLPVLGLTLVAFGACGKPSIEPVLIAWVGESVGSTRPEALGRTLGVMNFVGVFSGVLGPLVSGLIKDLTGSLAGAFWVGAALSAAGALLTLLARESAGRRAQVGTP
jgi:MFS family permease